MESLLEANRVNVVYYDDGPLDVIDAITRTDNADTSFIPGKWYAGLPRQLGWVCHNEFSHAKEYKCKKLGKLIYYNTSSFPFLITESAIRPCE